MESPFPFDAVLFDLDGTILDAVELISSSFRHATRSVLGEILPDEEIMRYVAPKVVQW